MKIESHFNGDIHLDLVPNESEKIEQSIIEEILDRVTMGAKVKISALPLVGENRDGKVRCIRVSVERKS